MGGKSDPYVRLQLAGNVCGRTEVVNNNLNPVWDEIIYMPVHSLLEHPQLEVYDYQNLTKDRSLGSVELVVSDFAQKGTDVRAPYVSTGLHSRRDKIKLAKGSYKGELEFDIEFCPAVSLKGGVSFEPKEDAITAAVHAADAQRPVTPTTAASSVAAIAPVTPKTNGAELPMSPMSPTSKLQKEDAESGVSMSTEQLLATQSGVLVVNIVSGHLERKSRLEILEGDGYWPSFGTQAAASTNAKWDQVGEVFIRELDLSRITLRLNEHDESEKEAVIAEIALDTKLFLSQSLTGPKEFVLLAKDGSGRKSTVLIESRFIPVDIKLLPRESANNTGTLRVELLDATGLKAVDRGGKSDPYVVFELNKERVFKSETQKKTLAPVWKENFEVDVLSRVAADFQLTCYDWDRVGTADSLGSARIDLAELEPFEVLEKSLPLSHPKLGNHGSVRVRLVFQPAIIVRSRKNTSTFSTAGRTVNNLGHVPLNVGKAVGKGAFRE